MSFISYNRLADNSTHSCNALLADPLARDRQPPRTSLSRQQTRGTRQQTRGTTWGQRASQGKKKTAAITN